MQQRIYLPNFPKFRKVQITDKDIFLKLTKHFPPYSDYNFVSLWSYNLEGDAIVSNLYGNIVIRFRDYISNKPFYSFIGNKKLTRTIKDLLEYAESTDLKPELKLIPEVNLKDRLRLIRKDFSVKEERSHFDYIFYLERMSKLSGKKYNKKRNKLNRFIKDYTDVSVKQIDLTKKTNHKHLLYVFSHWSKNKEDDSMQELKALKRLLANASYFDLFCIGIYIKNKIKAFTITEILPQKFAIAHFTKADSKITGIFEFLYKSTADELLKAGCFYLNREQDLGLSGLRAAKLSWRPINYLKKYTISRKS